MNTINASALDTLVNLTKIQLSKVILTDTKNSLGIIYSPCYMNSDTWDLSMLQWPDNVSHNKKILNFPKLNSNILLSDMKEALVARWKIGVKGLPPWTPSSLSSYFNNFKLFSLWLDDSGIKSYSDITTDIALAYADYCRTLSGRNNNKLSKASLSIRLRPLDILWRIRDLVNNPLAEHPWPTLTSRSVAGVTKIGGYQRKTKVIPDGIGTTLFNLALEYISKGPELLSIRDDIFSVKEKHKNKSVGGIQHHVDLCIKNNKYPSQNELTAELIILRTSCYYLLGVTTGMRDHEIISLRQNCFYINNHDSNEYGWVKGRSEKLYHGDSEWMVPIDIGRETTQLLNKIAKPLRDQLKSEINAIQKILNNNDLDISKKNELVNLIRNKKDISEHLFIGKKRSTANITILTTMTTSKCLKSFSKLAGVEWNLHSHQFRPTFACWVSGHVLGDLRYLRDHFKHWSLDMTLLYAMNVKQDEALYELLYDEMHSYSSRVVDHWLDESTPLSGGASDKIKAFRKRRNIKQFKDHREMIISISDKITIRGTGTSWCLSDLNGCGGLGIIDKGRCIYCHEGVIDDTQAQTWLNIYAQQKELLSVDDIGPGGRQRVLETIKNAEKVLCDLGIDYPKL